MNTQTFTNRAEYNMNFEIGSSHWFNTLVGSIRNMGLYLANNENAKRHLIEEYGDKIEKAAMDLLEWREQVEVPGRYADALIEQLEGQLADIKEFKKSITINNIV